MDYRFVEKDPVVDLIRTTIHDSRRNLKDIAKDAYVSPSTISKWLYGEVSRPQNFTIFKVCKALNIKVEYVYSDSGNAVIPQPELVEKYKKPAREFLKKFQKK
jgi:transcriptional regulator with XRE-family HTH domain